MIHNKLKLYVPIKESICNNGKNSKKENDIKFHGKPDKIFPLKNSEIDKVKEKTRIKEMLLNFLKKNKKNVANP